MKTNVACVRQKQKSNMVKEKTSKEQPQLEQNESQFKNPVADGEEKELNLTNISSNKRNVLVLEKRVVPLCCLFLSSKEKTV